MFGTVDIKTRPLKLAFLVEPNNARQVREAIRLSSTLWGGKYFPIIPLHKGIPKTWRERHINSPSAQRVISGYIEAFDPDVLVRFTQNVPQYISQTGRKLIEPADIWCDLDQNRNLSPQFGIGLFELFNDIFEKHFKFKAKYSVKVVIPKLPKHLSLFWASLFGEIPSKLSPLIAAHYYEPLEIKDHSLTANNFDELLAADVLFPFRITSHGINTFHRSGFRGHYAHIFFMDASKIEDVVDYWNLRAMGKQVLPMPKQLKDNSHCREMVIRFLKLHRRPWRHDPKHCDHATIIRARSCNMEEMQEYVRTLKIERNPGDASEDPFFSLQHWYPRVWDEWARDKDGAVPSDIYGDDTESIDVPETKDVKVRFQPLLPKFAQDNAYHGQPRCANEMSFRFYGASDYIAEVIPQFSGDKFIRTISGLMSLRGNWRVGRNGLVKLVKHTYTETRDIPLAENLFFAWLEDLGWTPKLSPPGILARQIYRALGGSSYVLKNEKVLGLLEYMNGGSVQRDGSPSDKNRINQERDLAVGHVKTRLETGPETSNPYDYLIEKGCFRIGLHLQCPHCLRNSWYSLESVRDPFSCPKCLTTFNAAGNVDEATWSYKTTGPFSVPNYADGAYAVLLTLAFFSDHKLSTFRITPAMSFVAESHDKKRLEADFAAFWQESVFGEKSEGLVFGECKTYGTWKKEDFQRVRYLAKAFPGAVLVFSTLRKSITPQEKSNIIRIAKRGRKYWKPERPINPVLLLTGNELLHEFGPPYCWEDLVGKRFDRVHGLLSICDATQQMYLGMPSWHTEWHEKWERKRQQRFNK